MLQRKESRRSWLPAIYWLACRILLSVTHTILHLEDYYSDSNHIYNKPQIDGIRQMMTMMIPSLTIQNSRKASIQQPSFSYSYFCSFKNHFFKIKKNFQQSMNPFSQNKRNGSPYPIHLYPLMSAIDLLNTI